MTVDNILSKLSGGCSRSPEGITAKSKTGKGEDGQERGSKKGRKERREKERKALNFAKKVPGTFLHFME
ncbi:MAG: hypothetical protein LBK13_03655 [Spirochaetales bacterium]|jgi:hypothetical protein|nr:hypothetical protein [Spirochaetales bacterium]